MALRTGQPIPLLPISEEYECGDTSNVELCCQVPIVVYVHFREDHFFIEFLGKSPQDWCHSVARSAPICPEVHDNWSSFPKQILQVPDGCLLYSSSHTICLILDGRYPQPVLFPLYAFRPRNWATYGFGFENTSSREPVCSILPGPITATLSETSYASASS